MPVDRFRDADEAEFAGLFEGHENAGKQATLVGTAYRDLKVIQVARVSLQD